MSLDNLREYARRCATDPELLDRAREIGMANVDEHMNHAESLGLEWTRGDLALFRKELVDAEGEIEDLSEEELEEVAGGGVTTTACVAVCVAVGVGAGAAVGGAAGAAVGGGVSAAAGGGW